MPQVSQEEYDILQAVKARAAKRAARKSAQAVVLKKHADEVAALLKK